MLDLWRTLMKSGFQHHFISVKLKAMEIILSYHVIFLLEYRALSFRSCNFLFERLWSYFTLSLTDHLCCSFPNERTFLFCIEWIILYMLAKNNSALRCRYISEKIDFIVMLPIQVTVSVEGLLIDLSSFYRSKTPYFLRSFRLLKSTPVK